MLRALGGALLFTLLLSGAQAQAPVSSERDARDVMTGRLQVTDPYIELRTGPGRVYPITMVGERNTRIEILLRKTDWYKVRTDDGRIGWVHRSQLENTLTEAGTRQTFRDILLDDYLARRLEMGGAWGQFKAEPMLKVWLAYRLADTLTAEATLGQVQGIFSGTDFWHINLHAEPWSDQRLSPFFGIGVGKFRNIPNASLVGAIDTNAKMAQAMLGLRYYMTDRFVLRTDYGIYTAFVADTRSQEFRAVTVGLSFFF